MRLAARILLVTAAVLLIAIPLSEQRQNATANNESEREKSAFCGGVVERVKTTPPTTLAASLMRFAGHRRITLGLPWEAIFRRSGLWYTRNFNSPAPLISGLPAETAPPPLRSLLVLPQIVDVSVTNNYFVPNNVRISVGDTVRWTWQGFPHSVTSGQCDSSEYEDCTVDNKFCSPSDLNCASSPPSGSGTVYSHQFNTAGSFPYFCNVHVGLMNGTVIVEGATTPTIQFSAGAYTAAESGGAASIAVSRAGATTSEATVNYATTDTAGLNNCSVVNGAASSRCDYPTSVGTVRFAAGEASKNISIPIVDDSYAEGTENFTITISNANGGALGSPISATVTINDNEGTNGPNPIDLTSFFVRQHYIDFLTREPDPGGYAAWQGVINNCSQGDTTCDRIHVSSAFFRSPEFQDRGYFVYRFYPVAFGRKPDYDEFVPDIAKVSGFLSASELEAAKVAFIAEFMSRAAFVNTYNGLNNTQYVDTLLATAGVAPHQFRDFWVAALGNGTRTRAQVLREISESPEVYNKYYNQAFVVMQYFGYLRRDPDALYVNWIQVLDSSGDFRGMVNGFMNSTEYRARFGP